MSGRRFGVEIEFVGMNCERTAAIVTANGFPCRFEGYNHIDGARWKVVTDVSVSGTNRQGGGGGELVSPPLRGADGIAEVQSVLTCLNAAGIGVNRTCGLHVHVDADGLVAADLANVVVRYARHEPEIDALMPPSRRGSYNSYCMSMRGVQPRGQTIEEVVASVARRQSKVNLQAYLRHGTIEFRQHSGTTNASKVSNWIRFCTQFVDASRTGRPAGGTVAQHIAADLSASQRRIVNALSGLAGHGVDPNALAMHSRLGFESMRSALSALRKKGYVITLDRRANLYRMTGRPTSSESCVDALPAPPASLWTGIDADVREYYRVRAAALATDE